MTFHIIGWQVFKITSMIIEYKLSACSWPSLIEYITCHRGLLTANTVVYDYVKGNIQQKRLTLQINIAVCT